MEAVAGTSPVGRRLGQDPALPHRRAFLWIVALALAYYATAVVGYARLAGPVYPSLALLWAPNVLLLAALLVSPVRLWPAILGACFVMQIAVAATIPIPLGRSLGMFVGNVSQSLIAAAVLRRLGDWRDQFDTFRGVTAFVLVAVIGAPALASLLAALVLTATAWVPDPWLYWRLRFVTNVLSTVVLAPPLLILVRDRGLPHASGPRLAEFAGLLLLLGASERIVSSIATPLTVVPLLFAPLPFLLWAAVRFEAAGLGLVLCFTALFRYFADFHPVQVGMRPSDAFVATQLTLIAISLPLLFLSALLAERRRTEQELRTGHTRYGLATVAGSVGVWDWNLETNDIYVDPALKNILGFADEEIVNHLDDWGLRVHPEDGERVMAAAQAHIDGRTTAFEVPHRMVHKDGSIRWFLARGVVVERKGGRATRMTGTDTDITAQKEAEHALEEARAELAKLTRLSEMGGLTATIAHEVNQPLCAIVANASAALRWLGRDLPDMLQVRGALEDVVRDGKRASDLIRRTRRLFEQGGKERQPVDLNTVVDSALTLTRASRDSARVVVHTALDPDLPQVPADQVQLQQVFCNLIVNAVDAMVRAGSILPSLTITTRRENGGVYATVVDTGEGLGEDPERIFRPLVTTQPEGMGIGLSMSRMIVEMHGGRLWATHNEGAGATFHVVLPLSELHG
jgi:two-component system, LuxR family, sensor kinase FixL